MPSALIVGIGGQDGAYLARCLLQNGYRVWGASRQTEPTEYSSLRALGIHDHIQCVPADVRDGASLRRAIELSEPDEIYNLAAQSSVAASFESPTLTGEINGLGAARLLQAVCEVRSQARFFQASSCEMFGSPRVSPQNESTPLAPRSPYGIAKAYAHWMSVHYRESLGLHASCGILFNHESPLRPEQFVTRKVARAVARIKCGLQESLSLGNLDVQRDWGFAGDTVEAMRLMLQQDAPDDYIIATGQTHSLREFVEKAFACAGLNYQNYVRVDPAFFRPAEASTLVGDNRKAKEKLGWSPRLSFEQLVEFLVEAELKRVAGDEAGVCYVP